MPGFPNPFSDSSEEELFDEYDEFVPEHIPEPGPFLDGHRVFTSDEHLAFHRTARDVFEERTVYDMTFDYNLARLNLDTRHENAGYRYAEERDDPDVLRAEFTPTTPFCPQSNTLTIASFQAWNGLSERHDYEIVRVRLHPMHHNAEPINEELERLEEVYWESGSVEDLPAGGADVGSNPMERAMRNEGPTRGGDPPF